MSRDKTRVENSEEKQAMQSRSAEAEIRAGERFAFGANWRRFLRNVDEQTIEEARVGLMSLLPMANLQGRRFLDAGCGSGLSSLAAHREGAEVLSFDFDQESVACSRLLRARFAPDPESWQIESGSVLDDEFLHDLGEFDVVYSWGVLHHTGQMWRAIDSVKELVGSEGYLYIALYNDQSGLSRYWHWVKRTYNRGLLFRWLMTLVHLPYLILGPLIVRTLTGRLRLRRGMSLWWDMHDWLGGLPFEVASPSEVTKFLKAREFKLIASSTVGRRHGCNEFVFQRQRQASTDVA